MRSPRLSSMVPGTALMVAALVMLAGCSRKGAMAGQASRRQDEAAQAAGLPKEIALDLGNGVSMKLVLIPAGKFRMGSPKGEKERNDDELQHKVVISKPFYMGACTVTQEQYERAMGVNPSDFGGATNPVENVLWDDAAEFCLKLSRETGQVVRLPTEAEWEYACRAGTTTPFNTGQTITTAQANFDGLLACGYGEEGEDRFRTMPVGSFQP